MVYQPTHEIHTHPGIVASDLRADFLRKRGSGATQRKCAALLGKVSSRYVSIRRAARRLHYFHVVEKFRLGNSSDGVGVLSRVLLYEVSDVYSYMDLSM